MVRSFGVAPGIAVTRPTWSPDGASLAFVRGGGSGGACNADGSPCGSARRDLRRQG